MDIVMETPAVLAWMGDAIYTAKVRETLLAKGLRRPNILQKESAKYNSAAGQAHVLSRLEQQGLLLEDEQEIVRRGRNAHVKSLAKNADPKDYMAATALEALFGYLYLYNRRQRMDELLDVCMELGGAQ